MSSTTDNPFEAKAKARAESSTVTDIHDADVVQFGGSASTHEEIKPMKFRIGDDPRVFTVYEPDAGTVMSIEEAGTSRRALSLFLGEEWGAAEPLLEPEHPDTLIDMVQGMSRHFKLYEGAPDVNRATRRRQARRGR
jgi:hypothetical protein